MANVRKWVAARARNVAPRTIRNLEALSRANAEFDGSGSRIIVYERELRDMRREVDALRREHRRVIELYDAVFDYVRANANANINGVSNRDDDRAGDEATTTAVSEPGHEG